MSVNALRLDAAIKGAGVIIESVVIDIDGQSSSVFVRPSSAQAAAQPIIDAFDWSQAAQDAWESINARTTGQDAVDNDRTAFYKVQRAIASLTIDEINVLRSWITSFKAEVAAATNLADLKTRVAALPNMPDRTLTQAKTAIKNTIANGSVD